ncbi:MAG TPA: hypothetical protein VFK40_13805 [Nitrososphaeraceae archaeon]|nr:hypothetical protein [Nitrososphaeraceae archaeon]
MTDQRDYSPEVVCYSSFSTTKNTCEKDYMKIQQQHGKRNKVEWFGALYFESVRESKEMK